MNTYNYNMTNSWTQDQHRIMYLQGVLQKIESNGH